MTKRTNHPVFTHDDFEDFTDADDEIIHRTGGAVTQAIPAFVDFVSGMSKKQNNEDDEDE